MPRRKSAGDDIAKLSGLINLLAEAVAQEVLDEHGRHVPVASDWRTNAGYPTEDAPLAEWRWQALRRRQDYQRDFAAGAADGTLKCPTGAWRTTSATADARARYGLRRLLDPTCPHAPPHYFGRECSADVQADINTQRQLRAAGYTLVLVDLRAPILAQLEHLAPELTKLARERGQKAGRQRRMAWQRHLRVLDATAAGATAAEIAKVLATGHWNTRDVAGWRKLAREWQLQITAPANLGT